MLRKIILGAVLLVGVFAAPAAAQYPEIVVNPGTVVVGGQVSVSGTGCEPGVEVIIYLVPAAGSSGSRAAAPTIPANAVEVGRGTAGPDGTFTVTFTVPADTEPGNYIVQSSCGNVASEGQNLTVTAPVPPVTQPGGPATPLPRTGSDLNGLGLLGAGLLTAGGLALLATRRRRTSSVAV